jgi:hypothetical protein
MARHGEGERRKDPVVGLAVELVFGLVWNRDPKEQATVSRGPQSDRVSDSCFEIV